MKKVRHILIIVSLAVLGFTLFITSHSLGTANPIKSERPSFGGTLVIGVTGDVDTFNPLFNESSTAQEITHLLLLGLADLNDKSEFVPELASSWERSDDYMKLTYHLRKDARWADGQPITANDVKFTYDLLMDTTVGSPRLGDTEYIKKVVINDKHTVTFEFTKPYPDQIYDTAGEILPKHILENVNRHSIRSHKIGRSPLSSGPFVLKKWVSQQYIELAPNENYFGDRAYLDRVIFKIVPDNTNLLLQLQTGEVDMMIGVPAEKVSQLQNANSNISIYPVSGRLYYYIGYNLTKPLFSSAKVRKALTMAIDRRGITNALLYGYGKPCLGPLPPMIEWVYNKDVKGFPFDQEQATKLLTTEGWLDHDKDGWLDKDGQIFEFTLKINSGNQLRSDVAVIVQDQLKQIGIKVHIQTIEWSTLMGELHAGKFDACIGGWNTSFNVDLTPLFHSSATDLFNFVRYNNSEVDRLIETGREEMDRQKSAKIWKHVQQLIYDDQPYTFLFWIDKIVAVNNKFKNVNPIPLSAIYELEKWYQADNTVN